MKSKKLVVIICMLVTASVFPIVTSSLASDGNIIYVDDDAPPEWYDATHVKTIQEGIDAASDGDTVFVYSGTYYENVEIYTSVILRGEDKENTIVDAGGSGDVIFVSVDNVEITGFTLINSGSDWLEAGIELHQIDHCKITGNIISDCGYGIATFITSDITISWNVILDNDNNGIRLQDTTHSTITRNSIQNNHRGIYLNAGYFNEIKENNFINNDRHAGFYGVLLNEINNNYWERLINNGPMPIFGKLFLLIPLPGVIFDWNPAKEPYDITGEDVGHSKVGYENPLSFRVEFVKLCDRVWKINGYATNTFDEEVTVRWGCFPCVFAFFYAIPDEDLNLLVGQYHTNFYNLKYYNKWFEFEPGEEKLIDSKLFFGISNRFTWGLSEGYQQYFESWPILPDGDYEVRASLSPYQNENYEMISMGVQETLIFQYS